MPGAHEQTVPHLFDSRDPACQLAVVRDHHDGLALLHELLEELEDQAGRDLSLIHI